MLYNARTIQVNVSMQETMAEICVNESLALNWVEVMKLNLGW